MCGSRFGAQDGGTFPSSPQSCSRSGSSSASFPNCPSNPTARLSSSQAAQSGHPAARKARQGRSPIRRHLRHPLHGRLLQTPLPGDSGLPQMIRTAGRGLTFVAAISGVGCLSAETAKIVPHSCFSPLSEMRNFFPFFRLRHDANEVITICSWEERLLQRFIPNNYQQLSAQEAVPFQQYAGGKGVKNS